MSQIYFDGKDNTEVLTGYDRPLNYCFLTVFDKDTGEVVWSALDERDCFSWDTDAVIAQLEALDIPYPADLPERLATDEMNKTGNQVYRYT